MIKPEEGELSKAEINAYRFNSRRFLKTQASIIRSQGFITRIAGELGLPKRWDMTNRKTSSILKSSTKVSRNYRNREIIVEFSSKTPAQAVEIANAIANSYVDHWKNLHSDRYDEMVKNIQNDHRQFKSAVAVKLAALDVLESDKTSTDDLARTKAELAELRVRNATFESQIEKINLHKLVISSSARIDEKASMDNVTYGAKIGAGFAFLLWMAVLGTSSSVAYQYIRTNTRTSIADIAKAVSPPILTLFPRSHLSFSEMTGPFEKLRDGILSIFPVPEGVAIASVPCLVNEDASPVTCELAKVLAAGGHTTLVIEGNLKEPMIHHTFNASPHPGVSDYLLGEMEMKETVVKTRYENLWIMPGGTLREDTTALLSNGKMVELIKDAKSRFDFVIFNGAPILKTVDSLILIGESNMTFLCTEAGKAPNDVLTKARFAIDQAGGKLAGLVLTEVDPTEAGKDMKINAAVVKA